MSSRPARSSRLVAPLVLVAAAAVGAVAAGPLPAAAYASSTVTLAGHGYGHGRGMGQYGAFGDAVSGWTYDRILTAAYGTLASGSGTHLGTWTQDTASVRVAITANAGDPISVTSQSPFTVDGTWAVPADGNATFTPAGGGLWNVAVDDNPDGCSPSGAPTVATGVANPVAAPGPAPFPADGNLAAEVLRLCQAGGNEPMRGSIEGTANSNGAPRTIDVLPLEQYVADVTPAESPASWGTVGGPGPENEPWGFQSTMAQAVAARSYVTSTFPGGYYGYADTCDSTACQAYPGIADENPVSTAAVVWTYGTVVMLPSGVPATTEYSASTGGYSEPGTFAAEPDPGDGVCVAGGPCGGVVNPYHSYTASIPVSAVEADFPQIGTLEALNVTATYPGGRVETLDVVGSSGSVSLSGAAFAGDVAGQVTDTFADGSTGHGIISDFFAVESQASGGTGGYWLADAAGGVYPFGDAVGEGSMAGSHLNQPVVGMAATTDHRGYWLDAADGGIFAFGDAPFDGSMGGQHLNQPMVGMAADPAGGYWLVAADGGVFAFGGAPFYGSMGGSHLNQPMVGMAATPDGGGYWLVAADGGVFAYGDAAFSGSMGGSHLNQPVVAMAAGPHGGYWMIGSDGGIFAFGVPYEGSLPGSGIAGPATAILPTADGGGYLITTGSGHAYPFGDAPYFGDLATSVPGWASWLVGGATTPG